MCVCVLAAESRKMSYRLENCSVCQFSVTCMKANHFEAQTNGNTRRKISLENFQFDSELSMSHEAHAHIDSRKLNRNRASFICDLHSSHERMYSLIDYTLKRTM